MSVLTWGNILSEASLISLKVSYTPNEAEARKVKFLEKD